MRGGSHWGASGSICFHGCSLSINLSTAEESWIELEGLVAREKMISKTRKIMVALEGGTQKSIYVLQWALNYLIPPLSDSNTANHFVILFVSPRALLDAADAETENGKGGEEGAVELVKNTSTKHNITYETKVVVGEAKVVICEAAKQVATDLLVVGSHDYGGTKRLFSSGCVGDYCVRNSKCPVVVVKGHSAT